LNNQQKRNPKIYESVIYADWVRAMKINRALLSVSDKTKIKEFATDLVNHNIEIISTGGTSSLLKKNKIPHLEISTVTNFPEILNGRVKTLHPNIHAGILAKRENKEHMQILKSFQIKPIDLVLCNLYPFEQTINKKKATLQEIIENIDIGGPTLIRSAAKNYKDVIIITHHNQFPTLQKSLKENKEITLSERERFALVAFSHTAQYDAIISTYLRNQWTDEQFPLNNTFPIRKKQEMRYGENPHLKAGFYEQIPLIDEPCISNAYQIQGKALSYNNILDGNGAIEAIKEFSDPTCVIIKHATPCGIASADNILESWNRAYNTDTYSPFGGIVAFNRTVGKKIAEELNSLFLEVIIAPSYTKDSLNIFSKKKNLRVLQLKNLDKLLERKGITFRSVVGGVLVQERDIQMSPKEIWKIVTKKKPTTHQLISMDFAVRCVKHIKSNSVVFVKGTETVGIGGGQTARVDATWIATHKGKERIKNSILASDAFFPFRDAVDLAASAGIEGIIQPGGSIRDEEVIRAADEHGITMVFTGQRYFRH
jgi:phosphoribosylaminoimidazolecarboxamide formyltransferase/IMP cyclohydrolase